MFFTCVFILGEFKWLEIKEAVEVKVVADRVVAVNLHKEKAVQVEVAEADNSKRSVVRTATLRLSNNDCKSFS